MRFPPATRPAGAHHRSERCLVEEMTASGRPVLAAAGQIAMATNRSTAVDSGDEGLASAQLNAAGQTPNLPVRIDP